MDLVRPAIEQLQTQKPGLFSLGAVVALWSASSAVRSSMDAMNRVYDVVESRPAWKRIPLSVLYTLGVAAFLLAAAGLMITGPQAMGWLAQRVGIEEAVVILWNWLRIPAAILLMMAVVATLYYLLPDVKQEFRFITPGSVLAVLAWLLASFGFSYYAQHFATYNAMYGSIGAIIILLLYLYLSAAVLLLGAELNAVIEHHSREGKNPGERRPGKTAAWRRAEPSLFLDVQQQVFEGFAVFPRFFPQAALLGFQQAFGDVTQGLGVVLLEEGAGVGIQQVGVGQQGVLVVVHQLGGGVEGEQVVHRRGQFEGALVAVALHAGDPLGVGGAGAHHPAQFLPQGADARQVRLAVVAVVAGDRLAAQGLGGGEHAAWNW